jgi:hypothetical protein
MPADKGNRNALKHGLYARNFTDTDHLDLRRMPTDSALHELGILRLCVARLMDLYDQNDDKDKRVRYITRAVEAACAVVNVMVKEQLLTGHSPVVEDLWTAIKTANEMQGVDDAT